MKLIDQPKNKIEVYKAIEKAEETSVANAVESLISDQRERTYYDRVFDELGGDIRAIEEAIANHKSKFNELLEVLRSQGHLKEGKRRTSFDGKIVNTSIWSEEAEAIIAKFRFKSRKLEHELMAARNRINIGFPNLIDLALALDSIDYIKKREKAYIAVSNKMCEMIPLMEEMLSYGFDVCAQGAYNMQLSDRWQRFVLDFIKAKPDYLSERRLKRAFESELIKAKEHLNNRKRMKSVAELIEEL